MYLVQYSTKEGFDWMVVDEDERPIFFGTGSHKSIQDIVELANQASALSGLQKTKKTVYQVILSLDHLGDLEKSIDEELADGWKCQGGISVAIDEDGSLYYTQAMIKEGN